MKKRIISLLLSLIMVISLLPAAFAADTDIAEGDGWYIDENGCLFITGAVTNRTVSGDRTPWRLYKSAIITAVAEEGASLDNANSLFANCSNFISADFSLLDTSEVTDMTDMFKDCASLAELDVSGFDTSCVEYMSGMFSGCASLEELDLSSFDTACVTDMYCMFSDCESLSSLDLSGFDTALVCDMSSMFSDCASLSELDVSGFDVSCVEDMSSMFYGCAELASLDLSSFAPSCVESMYCMFSGCESLASLDLSAFDTASVYDMDYMFEGCSSLKTLDVDAFDTSCVENMYAMFSDCSALTSLDLSSFDTSCVCEMVDMFAGCSSLKTLDVSSFDTSCVENMYGMFSGCSSLKSLDVSGFDTSCVYDMSFLFEGCSSLTSLDVSAFDLSSEPDASCMFDGCTKLQSLGVNPEILAVTADQLMEISAGGWMNAETNELYEDEDALTAIEDAVTLTLPAANSASLSLEGDIGVNFYLDLNAYAGAAKVEITHADPTSEKGARKTEVFENFADYKSGSTYKFSVQSAAAQMTEDIVVKIYNADNAVLYSKTTTVRDMLETYIDYYSAYPVIADLCKNMLTYAGYAQVYFDYKTDDLAYINYCTDISTVTPGLVEKYDTVWTDADESDSFAYYAQTFSCRSNTVMRYAFHALPGTSFTDYTAEFTSGGDEYEIEITAKGSDVVVSVVGIPAAALDNFYTFEIKLGGTVLGSVSSCGMCYVKLVLNNPSASASLVDLAKSIYLYNAAANTYFRK